MHAQATKPPVPSITATPKSPNPISAEYAQSLLRMLTGGNDSLFSEPSLLSVPNGQQLYMRHSLHS